MASKRPGALAGVLILGAVALATLTGLLGFGIGHYTKANTVTTVGSPTPSGHVGQNLPVAEIGNPAAGRMLFVSQRCGACHSFLGNGGSDAPPLDIMRGHLSARDVANMSGRIWNHLPFMLERFKKEGIPLPTFSDNEMADLIAYLHSGRGGPPPVEAGEMPGGMGEKPGPLKPGNPQRGKSVFISAGCGGCHTLSTVGARGTIGPNLDTALSGKSAEFIKQSIVDPNATIANGFKPNVMPAQTLPEQDLADLVAFFQR